MAQPLLGRLRAQRAEAVIDVLAPEWVAPVARRMPEVSEVIAAPLRHGELQWGERRRLAAVLRARAYDQAFVLPNTWKSALIPFFAGIPRRTGYVGELRYGLLNDARKTAHVPMAEHYARLAGEGATPQPKLRASPQEIAQAKRRFGIEGAYAALCPGAEYGPAKRWPYFAELAAPLPLPAVLLGSPGAAPAAARIGGTNLVRRT